MMPAFRLPAAVLAGFVVLALPLIREDGHLLIVAAVAAYTMYEGARARVVYGSVAFLLLADVLYGTDPGIAVLAYVAAVLLLRAAQRIISVPAWGAADGWRTADMLRSIALSWLLSGVTIGCAVFIGDALYGYGFIAERAHALATVYHITAAAVTCVVVTVAVRRRDVPFRQQIRFGS